MHLRTVSEDYSVCGNKAWLVSPTGPKQDPVSHQLGSWIFASVKSSRWKKTQNLDKEQQHSNKYISNATMGILTVFLDKCTGLKDADALGKSDPYVTLTAKKKGFVSMLMVQ